MFKLQSIDSVDALKISIQCEKDMKTYYEKISSLIKDEDALTIFKGLAEKEEKHRKKLIKTYSQVSGKKILYLNLGKKHKLNSLEKCGSDPNHSVRIAKKNEEELKSFYITISRRLIEPELRQLFREMAYERGQHYALLEASFVEPLALDQEPVTENENIMNEVTAHSEAIKAW